MQGTTAVAVTAARAARERAVQCRVRRLELAAGRQVTDHDVAEARAALEQAIGRTALAQARLAARLASWRRVAASPTARGVGGPKRRDPAALRRKIGKLELAQVWTAYLGLGGHCTEFELDAFAHTGFELAAEEIAVLDQAVWELTEF